MSTFDSLEEERLRRLVKKILRPKHKVYVRGRMILIHRKDFTEMKWSLVKLSLCFGKELTEEVKVSIYDTSNEFVWRALL